jgi:hypothetical protein
MAAPPPAPQTQTGSGKILIMAIGIFAAALGLLIAAACIVIPRVVSRRNDPYNNADALAYQKETGRSAREIEQSNARVRARQQDRSNQPSRRL